MKTKPHMAAAAGGGEEEARQEAPFSSVRKLQRRDISSLCESSFTMNSANHATAAVHLNQQVRRTWSNFRCHFPLKTTTRCIWACVAYVKTTTRCIFFSRQQPDALAGAGSEIYRRLYRFRSYSLQPADKQEEVEEVGGVRLLTLGMKERPLPSNSRKPSHPSSSGAAAERRRTARKLRQLR